MFRLRWGKILQEKYYTIKQFGETELIIERSRFICSINRVETSEEATNFIQQIKKKYPTATHHCFAYIIGEHDELQKANDDGEPSGTAGVPMLEILKKKQLKNTIAIVTRYYGGVKLGSGGLIRAYGKSVSEGLKIAGIVECTLSQIINITIDYTWLGMLENELHTRQYQIRNVHYTEKVTFEIFVDEKNRQLFLDWLTNLTNGQSSICVGELLYLEKDVL